MNNYIEDTITARTAQRFYSWLGARHDLGARFERKAKLRALDLLDLGPGQSVLDLGCGTGAEHGSIWNKIGPSGRLCAVDLSLVMVGLAADRQTQTIVAQADATHLPFHDRTFDRVFSTYMFDLLPAAILPVVLAECHRVMRPDGCAVFVSLTSGVDTASRAVVSAWQGVYRIHPLLLGGCRPVPLGQLVREAGFAVKEDRIIVQGGVPSEIVVACHPGSDRAASDHVVQYGRQQ